MVLYRDTMRPPAPSSTSTPHRGGHPLRRADHAPTSVSIQSDHLKEDTVHTTNDSRALGSQRFQGRRLLKYFSACSLLGHWSLRFRVSFTTRFMYAIRSSNSRFHTSSCVTVLSTRNMEAYGTALDAKDVVVSILCKAAQYVCQCNEFDDLSKSTDQAVVPEECPMGTTRCPRRMGDRTNDARARAHSYSAS